MFCDRWNSILSRDRTPSPSRQRWVTSDTKLPIYCQMGLGKPRSRAPPAGRGRLQPHVSRRRHGRHPHPATRRSPGILENFCRSLMRPNDMSLSGTVLAEKGLMPELLRLFRARLVIPGRAMLRAVLKRAQSQNLLREGFKRCEFPGRCLLRPLPRRIPDSRRLCARSGGRRLAQHCEVDIDLWPVDCYHTIAGWSSLVARWAHNPKVRGSNPLPATNRINGSPTSWVYRQTPGSSRSG